MLVHAFVLCCYAGTKRPAFAHPPCSELLFDLCATGPVGPGRHVQPETARELPSALPSTAHMWPSLSESVRRQNADVAPSCFRLRRYET